MLLVGCKQKMCLSPHKTPVDWCHCHKTLCRNVITNFLRIFGSLILAGMVEKTRRSFCQRQIKTDTSGKDRF